MGTFVCFVMGVSVCVLGLSLGLFLVGLTLFVFGYCDCACWWLLAWCLGVLRCLGVVWWLIDLVLIFGYLV